MQLIELHNNDGERVFSRSLPKMLSALTASSGFALDSRYRSTGFGYCQLWTGEYIGEIRENWLKPSQETPYGINGCW
jgi:hypothetical protein